VAQIINAKIKYNKIQELDKKVILITNSQRPSIQKILMKLFC
jgi:hypothetical protein